jgi:hypothetical protein
MSRVCASVGVANAADRKINMIFERSRIIAIPAPDLVERCCLGYFGPTNSKAV